MSVTFVRVQSGYKGNTRRGHSHQNYLSGGGSGSNDVCVSVQGARVSD